MTLEEENTLLRKQLLELSMKIVNPLMIFSDGDLETIEREVEKRCQKQFKHLCFNLYRKVTP
jgi:hypothetical protein